MRDDRGRRIDGLGNQLSNEFCERRVRAVSPLRGGDVDGSAGDVRVLGRKNAAKAEDGCLRGAQRLVADDALNI
jgi:hypothetical protein